MSVSIQSTGQHRLCFFHMPLTSCQPMAVFTPVPPSALARFLGDYEAGDLLSLHGLADGVENTNYLVETTTQRLILTLFEGRVQAADVPWYLAAMNFLAAQGIPCPVALPRRDGGLSGVLCGRPATLVTFLHGAAREVITPASCGAVGAFLARLHLAAANHQPPRANTMNLPEWRRLIGRVGSEADRLRLSWTLPLRTGPLPAPGCRVA
jgi:homoserine kinase type II